MAAVALSPKKKQKAKMKTERKRKKAINPTRMTLARHSRIATNTSLIKCVNGCAVSDGRNGFCAPVVNKYSKKGNSKKYPLARCTVSNMGKGSMTRESAWMGFWGLLFLYTGCQKIVNVIDTEPVFGGDYSGDPPLMATGVLLAGAIVEIIYGFVGFCVGLLYLVYGKENPTWSLAALVTQLFGIYTFTVFVLVQPGWDAGHLSESFEVNGFGQSDYKGLMANAIIGMSMYQLSLHFAFFFSTLDFYSQQTKNKNLLSARGCAGILNTVSLVAGLCTMSQGARIHYLVDLCAYHCGRLFEPIYLIPFPVVWPTLTLMTGVVQTFVSLVGIVRIFTAKGQADDKGGFSYFTLLSLLSWLIIISLSLLPNLGVDETPGHQYMSWWAILVPLATSLTLSPVVYEAKFLTGKDFNTKDFL